MTFLTPRTIELNDEFLHFESEFFQCPNLPHAPLNVEKTHFYLGKSFSDPIWKSIYNEIFFNIYYIPHRILPENGSLNDVFDAENDWA